MYLHMTVEETISQLYKKWDGDGIGNDAIIAAASLLERVRNVVGDDVLIADAIATMNDVAHKHQHAQKMLDDFDNETNTNTSAP